MTKGPRRKDQLQSPRPTWLPLQRAYLHYRSGSYLYTPEEWQTRAEAVIEDFAEADGGEHPRQYDIGPVGKDRALAVSASGVRLTIAPQTGRFALFSADADDPDYEEILRLEGDESEFLDRCRAYRGPSHLEEVIDWLQRLVEHLVAEQRDALAEAVACGAAHVMARKHDVHAGFERVMPDQLAYFYMEAGESETALRRWQPLLPSDSERSATAFGPGGEKLFSIHIAPGTVMAAGESAAEKWKKWIKDRDAENPSGLPFSKDELWARAQKDFRKNGPISKRGFDFLLKLHQPDHWKSPGRPRKTPAKNQNQ